jgi:hypothetical protein
VPSGRVQISTHVDIVEITRVSIDKPVVGELPRARTKGDVTIVPAFEEVPFVETRLEHFQAKWTRFA